MPVRRAHLDRLGRLAAIAIDSALAASGGPSGLKQKSFTGLSSPLNLFCGRADTHLRSPKPRKPTLKAPLPPRRGFRFCRGLRIDCVVHSPSRRMRLMAVPELTSIADIKLNARLSLRTSQTSLAWPQSRRLAAPQYGLRTVRSGVASCPRGGPALHKTKATRALRRMA